MELLKTVGRNTKR